jgi:hypothetical protein
MKTQLKEILGYDVECEFLESFPADMARAIASEHINFCKEYKLEMPVTKFTATRKSGGEVYLLDKESSRTYKDHLAVAKEINLSRFVSPQRTSLFAKEYSRSDYANLSLSTLRHEQAHLLFDSRLHITKNTREFARKLDEIEAAYKAELKKATGAKKAKLNLGKYATRNTDEFMAEAWQEYRNSSSPSKYAKLVGELIDSFFKK